MNTELHSTSEAARRIDRSPSTMRRIMDRGEIETVRIGARVLISDQAIEDYLARNTRPARVVPTVDSFTVSDPSVLAQISEIIEAAAKRAADEVADRLAS